MATTFVRKPYSAVAMAAFTGTAGVLSATAGASPIGTTNAIVNPGFETLYEHGTTTAVSFTHTNVYTTGLNNAPVTTNSGGTTSPASPGNIDVYGWTDAVVPTGTDSYLGINLNAHVTDTTNTLYIGPSGVTMDVYQDVGPVSSELLPNTTYNFSVEVYGRYDVPVTSYTMGLSTGSTITTSTIWTPVSTGANTVPANDGGVGTEGESTYTFAYTTGSSLPSGDLYVFFGTNSLSGTQTNFDNVSLVQAPEPASLGLLGVAVCGLMSRPKRFRRV